MATFGQNLAKESREGLRDYFEERTGIIGQALRSKREKTEQQKQAQAQAERINTATAKLRSTNAALSSMEASFIQMSKNMRLIAEAMGAEVTLQEETDRDRKKLDEIAKRRLELQQEIGAKKRKDLSRLNRKVNESLKQQKQDKSIFEKIMDALDDLPGGKRGGRGGRGGSRGRIPGGGRVPGGGGRLPPGKALGAAGRVAGAVGLGLGAYEAGKFARESELGRRLEQGQGGAAQAALRGRDQVVEVGGGERRFVKGRDTNYGIDITPQGAKAILDQPDTPGKRRDIEAFGGKERLEKIAKQAREEAPARTRREIYGEAAGRQRQNQPTSTTDNGAAFRRSERAYVGTQASDDSYDRAERARLARQRQVAGPAVTAQRDVQEHVFTGPMVANRPQAAAAAPAPAPAPAPAQAAAAPRPAAAQQSVQPGSSIADKKTDDQGAKNPGPGAPQRREGTVTRPKNVIIGPNADLSPNKVNQGLLQRIYLAAEKYGKPITITSGFRPDSYQALLYVRGLGGQKDKRQRPADWPAPEPGIYIPSLPKTDQTVTWKGRTFDVPGSGKHNVHLEMSELDISPGVADAKWVAILKEFGVVFPYGALDPPHTSIMRKNRDGADAPPLASLLGGEVPSNVVMSGTGIPITTGTGGFVTSGTPAAPIRQEAPALGGTDVVKDDIPTQADARGKFQNASAFYRALYPYAEMVSQKLGGKIPPSAILAQWTKETGGGSAISGRFNYAGIYNFGMFPETDELFTEEKFTDAQYADFLRRNPANKDRVVKIYTSDDDEFPYAAKRGKKIGRFYSKEGDAVTKAAREGKKWYTLKSPFARFKNLRDFAEGYIRVLSNPRYKQVLEQTTAEGFARTAVASGYATANAASYGASVSELSASIEREKQTGFQPTVVVVQNTNNTVVKKPGGTQVAGNRMGLVGG